MFERSSSPDRQNDAEYSRSHDPEHLESAEFRMPGERDSNQTVERKSSAPRDDLESLFTTEQSTQLHDDWEDVQAAFVDNPREAVKRADHLVERTTQQIADRFARERENLERQWDSGDDVSTEELRILLQRYRAFFNRLLTM